MVQLLADWQDPTPCCGLLTCWSAAGSAWQCCLSYACTNKPEHVRDHLRANLRQTENGLIRKAKWDLLTRANAVSGHCIQDLSYRVHQLHHRRAKANKPRHQSPITGDDTVSCETTSACAEDTAVLMQGQCSRSCRRYQKTAMQPTWWEEALPAWHQNFEGQAFEQYPSPPFVSALDRQPAQLPPMAPSCKLEAGESMVRALSGNGPAAVLPNCQPACMQQHIVVKLSCQLSVGAVLL